MEFYVEKPAPFMEQGQTIDVEREHLPHFFEPGEAWPDNPLHATYPFVLMSERPRFRVHSQWYNNKYLRELDPEPTVKINPIDAKARGIKSGDHVECFNDRGHAVALASVNEAIRPGTLVYPKSWQLKQHKAGGWSELSASFFDPVMVNSSFMDVLCEVKLWEGGN
jgi:anaerobic selenocysteine-containing dehydrogenase